MTIYRIYTERFDNLSVLTLPYFDAFTIYETWGYWQGKAENSAVIEIIGRESDRRQIDNLRANIKAVNNQQSVALVVFENVEVSF